MLAQNTPGKTIDASPGSSAAADDAGAVAVGIDIGGTKIAAGIVTKTGHLSHETSIPTPRPPRASRVRHLVETLLAQELAAADSLGLDVRAIGVGTAGIVDPWSGIVVSATDTLLDWVGTDIGAVIAAVCNLPVRVDNDVNAAAVAEVSVGAARSFRRCLIVAVGTGIGGALVADGRVERGATGTAGEIGHLPVGAVDGPACSCGRRGHLEAYASGPAMERRYAEVAPASPPADFRGIARLGESGDIVATRVISDAGSVLGRTLGGLVNVFDPEVVVLGGGVVEGSSVYMECAQAAFRAELLPTTARVLLLTAHFRSNAGLVGAGILALEDRAEAGSRDA